MSSKTKDLTKMALLLALTCVSAYISFPNPMGPGMISAITIMLCLIGLILSPKQAFMTIIAYIILGSIGLPVFVGGTAGIGKIMGPTGGFIVAWPIAYTILSLVKGKNYNAWRYAIMSVVITIPVSYAIAIPWFMVIQHIDFVTAATMIFLPFVGGDIIKAFVAGWLGSKIRI